MAIFVLFFYLIFSTPRLLRLNQCFQVFGLVMWWHLIGQWQYGCDGTDLALYEDRSGGNGQVGSWELCWCESSSMGTGWPETRDWWGQGAWIKAADQMWELSKNSKRHCGQGWCNSASRGLRASKNQLHWTLKTVLQRFAECFNATLWILSLNTKIHSWCGKQVTSPAPMSLCLWICEANCFQMRFSTPFDFDVTIMWSWFLTGAEKNQWLRAFPILGSSKLILNPYEDYG